ncbi:MAG: phosphotransferase [Polyangiales bacterium]
MSEPDFAQSLQMLYGSPAPQVTIEKLVGDASSRRYFRVRAGDASRPPSRAIIMQLPEDAVRSDEGGSQPTTTRLPFLEVADLLRAAGVRVPTVYVEHLEKGQLVLEDLGDMTFERALRETSRAEWPEAYAHAVDLLAELHERCAIVPPTSIVAQRSFDEALLNWELDHFRTWGLEALFGALGPRPGEHLADAFRTIVSEMRAMPYGFVHRDYQSKNLMVDVDRSLTVIDFQDAMRGPRTYDLVALLCDSYVSLGLTLQNAMIDRYAAARRIDAGQVRDEFWVVALHRKLKDAGRFVFIDRQRSNPAFLQWYPQSLVYVGRALEESGRFSALGDVLESQIPGFPGDVDKPSAISE